jgi:flagellar biosynthesis regulator FlbT
VNEQDRVLINGCVVSYLRCECLKLVNDKSLTSEEILIKAEQFFEFVSTGTIRDPLTIKDLNYKRSN